MQECMLHSVLPCKTVVKQTMVLLIYLFVCLFSNKASKYINKYINIADKNILIIN